VKAFVIAKFTYSKRINVFHYDMFHGLCNSQGSHLRGDDLSQPLLLSRNGTRIPDVFQPGITLVLSARAKAALEGLPNVAFLPVEFVKLVDYPYQAGDFSYYEIPAFQLDPAKANPETLIHRLVDQPEMHERTSPHYELVIPKLRDVVDQFAMERKIQCELKMTPVHGKLQLRLSGQLLQRYPIVWQYHNILSEEAFSRLDPFIDWDYFEKAELDVD
jgi:hypothetical protein